MNTNSNTYTIIYSSIIVMVVAALLAWISLSLKPRQDANIKAETISQMLTATQFGTKEEFSSMGNDKVLDTYTEKIVEAFTIDTEGNKNGTLSTDRNSIELADDLKGQNFLLKSGSKDVKLPVYIFNKDGENLTVVPIYGGGLWGPVWGYIAFKSDLKTIVGAYFDHESETPGLGAKIKDDPEFRAQFINKVANFNDSHIFGIVKGKTEQPNEVDAITGATMTSNGLSAAIESWFEAYKPYFTKNGSAVQEIPVATDSVQTK